MGSSSSKKKDNENENKNIPAKNTINQKDQKIENEPKNEIKQNNLSNQNNPNLPNNINYQNNPYDQKYTNNFNNPFNTKNSFNSDNPCNNNNNNPYNPYNNNNNSYNPYNQNISYNSNNSYNNNNSYNQNNIDVPYQRYYSGPIPNYEKNSILYEKDDNLELTDYFNSNNNDNNEKDLNTYYNINKRYEDIKNRINYNNNNSDSERKLSEVNTKVNLDFGFKNKIEEDFKRTKTSILYCSNLSLNDEKYINSLDYNKYIREENQSKNNILKIINSNKSFFIQLISKKDSKK